jgi:hypothetical protein
MITMTSIFGSRWALVLVPAQQRGSLARVSYEACVGVSGLDGVP